MKPDRITPGLILTLTTATIFLTVWIVLDIGADIEDTRKIIENEKETP